MDAQSIMDGVWLVIRQMAEKYPDIAGIGVTSFGETFVATDAEGTPLYPAMLYTDPRGWEERDELSEKIGRREILHITGVDPHEMYSISKMMWLKKHVPGVYEKTKHLFLIGDYVVFHLTGKAQIDYSLATRTQAFDIRELAWSDKIFAEGYYAPFTKDFKHRMYSVSKSFVSIAVGFCIQDGLLSLHVCVQREYFLLARRKMYPREENFYCVVITGEIAM